MVSEPQTAPLSHGKFPRLTNAALFVAILAAGAVFAWWSVERADGEKRADLLQRTRRVVQTLPVSRVQALSGTRADTANPAFARIKEQLAALRSVTPECRFIYLLGRKADGTIVFLVDSEPANSRDYSPPGQVFDEPTAELRRMFDTNVAVVEGPVTDRWGTWISGLVPLTDQQTGAVVAVVGMDMDVRDWTRDLVPAGLPAVLFSLTLTGIAIAFRLVPWRLRSWRHAEAAATVAVGLTITLTSTWLAYTIQQRTHREAFAQLASAQAVGVVDRFLDVSDIDLEALARFMEGGRDVTSRGFQRFVGFLTLNPVVHAWEWIPVVLEQDRQRVEQEVREAGSLESGIWQHDEAGRRMPSVGGHTTYPVLYAAPLGANADRIGYDLGSDPVNRPAIEQAARTGLASGTDPIIAVLGSASQKAIVVWRPVFEATAPQRLRGFAVAELRPGTLLKSATAGEEGSGLIVMTLFYLRADRPAEMLASAPQPDGARVPAAPWSEAYPIFAFGKTYSLIARPSPAFAQQYPGRVVWLTTAANLAVTLALAVAIGTMVTRRKDLERLVAERTELLREREEHLSATLHSIGDGVIASDARGRILSLNAAAEALTGWSGDDAQGRPIAEIFRVVHAGTRLPAEVPVGSAIRENRVIGLANHTALIARDGTERQIADSCAPIHNTAGGVIGAVLVFRDVTYEYRQRQQLRASEARFDQLAEQSRTIAWETDAHGLYTSVSRLSTAVLGYTPDELVGRMHFYDLHPAVGLEAFKQAAFAVFERKEPFQDLVNPARGKDGRLVWLSTYGLPIMNADGTLQGYHGSDTDVTNRQHEEEALREERRAHEAILADLFENAPVAYHELDKNGIVLRMNAAERALLGYQADEIVGRPVWELVAEKDREASREAVGRKLSGAQPLAPFRRHYVRRDGVELLMEIHDRLVRDEAGEIQGIRTAAIDVTDAARTDELFQRQMIDLEAARDVQEKNAAELARMVDELGLEKARTEQASIAKGEFLEALVADRTRELVREKAKAEAASIAKSQFLANMSHEIRTPLNGVIGMTEIALDLETDEVLHGILSTVNREADALLAVINDVLDYSKIEAGRMDIESIPFDLRTTIDDVASGFSLRASQKGLDINASLDPNVHALLIGDPGRLRQVFVNLVGNSIKFTSTGDVSLRGALLEDRASEVIIRFSITDTGIGIPKDKQAAIFESFTQVDGSTTRVYGGTGLGTTISRTLVALMGGTLSLESEEGRGTTFWFDLVFKKQLVEDHPRVKRAPVFRDLNVLIVDDNRNSRFVLREYLNSWTCHVVEAASAAEALAILDEWHLRGAAFGLVLSDYMMPEMNGFDLVRQIRVLEPVKQTPCIILTSAGNRGDGKSCQDIGIQGYLTKPIRRDDLYRAIEAVLSGSENDGDNVTGRLVTRHSIREQAQGPVTILLVEDYPTNQHIAVRHLRSAGYGVDVAENGLQAVQAFKKKTYDLILMDIQMPGMDGYEATKEIRQLEAASHRGRGVPIVAMTAHAVKEYIDRCIESGMDDYISKPVRRKALLSMVEKWASRIAPTDSSPSVSAVVEATSSAADSSPMDYADVLREFGDDKVVLTEVMDGFVENVDKQLILIRQALAAGDATSIGKEAHSIKGGAANLSARQLSDVAFVMEKLAKEGNLQELRETFPNLEKAFGRLRHFIASVNEDA